MTAGARPAAEYTGGVTHLVPSAQLALPSPDDPKGARFLAVADAVVRQLLVRGPNELRYSEVARSAGVSRAWLYKYFGADHAALVDYVVRLFGEAFGGMQPRPASDDVPGWRAAMVAGVRDGLRDVAAAPWLMKIYGRYRYDSGPLGVQLRDLQRRFVEKGTEELPAVLAQDRRAAQRMIEAFTDARLGMYMRWADASRREPADEEAVVAFLLAIVDLHVARCGVDLARS